MARKTNKAHCRVAEPVAEPVTRYYVIANTDTEEQYTGSVISNCEPVEAMRTMIGIVNNVSRETVTLVETSDGWKWWVQSTLDRGTARFTDPAPNPYRPAPVTLTHSYI